MRHPRRMMVCCVCAVFAAAGVWAEAPPGASAAPDILSACEADYPPYCFINERGEPDGFSVELFRAVARAMGRGVQFRIGPWAEVRGWLERGEVEALPLVGQTPEREKLYDFTLPYLKLHGAVVVREGETGVRGLEDLRGRTVAVMKGDNMEEFMRRGDYGVSLRTTDTFMTALRELSQGFYDAVVVQRLVALRLIKMGGITGLKVLEQSLPNFRQDFSFAVREGDGETLALLNEGLSLVMADGTFQKLHMKWFGDYRIPSGRHIVVGGDSDYPPFEFLDERGRPAGHTVDLVRAIARETGLDVEIRLGPWKEVLAWLDTGEVDIIQGIFYSPERAERFDFSPPHVIASCVGVVRDDGPPPPASLDDLRGLRLFVQENDIMHDYVRHNGLQESATVVDSQEEALERVLRGEGDCALVSRMVALYWIKVHGWSGLKVGKSPFVTSDYCFAARKGQGTLMAEFREGLKLVETSGEYREIHDKWLGPLDDTASEKTAVFLRYALMLLVPLLLIILFFMGWSWSLRRVVARQTDALKRTGERFKMLVEGAPDAIFVQVDGAFSYVNTTACQLLGGGESHEVFIGRQVVEFFHPSDRESVMERIRLLNHEKQRVDAREETIIRLDGSEVPVEVSAVPIVYEGNDGALVFMRDITDRRRADEQVRELLAESNLARNALLSILEDQKRAEEARRHLELRYRRLFESAKDGILILNAATGRVVDANPSVSRMIGLSQEEFLGRELWEIGGLRNIAASREAFDEMCRGDHIRAEDISLEGRDGGRVIVELVSNIYLVEGERVVQCNIRDISERRHLEQQLRQSQKMEAVGQLAGGVAHDFNNLLQVILGNTGIIRADLDSSSPILEDLEEVRRAAEKAADLTRQLLTFSRRQVIQPANLDMNALIGKFLKMVGRIIGEHIELHFNPGSDLEVVCADRGQVEQVLMNLCVNARDAMPQGGSLTITTANAVLDGEFCRHHPWAAPGAYVAMSVSDTGTGMDEATRARVFEPFFTTKEVGRGTGLGLATVYGIVKQHQGLVNVESAPGRGACFTVYLPRVDAPVDDSENGDSPPVAGGSEVILVAEDEKMVLQLVGRLLRGAGYTVLEACDGNEAVAVFEGNADRVDMALLDVMMPGMNGWNVMERLRARRPGLPVLFSSGYSESPVRADFLAAEGVRLMQKPYKREVLLREVRVMLDASAGKSRQ